MLYHLNNQIYVFLKATINDGKWPAHEGTLLSP